MAEEQADPRTVKFRKVMHYVDLYRMSRDERLGLAEYVLRRDVASFKDLTEPQLERLLNAFEGHALIQHLLNSRG